MRAKPPASAARIRLLVLDVDGVLTDGTLVFGSAGEETKRFHVRDGYAMQAARRAGLAIAVISGRASAAGPAVKSPPGFIPPDPPDIQHLAVRAAIHHYILCCQVILVNCATRAGKK